MKRTRPVILTSFCHTVVTEMLRVTKPVVESIRRAMDATSLGLNVMSQRTSTRSISGCGSSLWLETSHRRARISQRQKQYRTHSAEYSNDGKRDGVTSLLIKHYSREKGHYHEQHIHGYHGNSGNTGECFPAKIGASH